MSTLRSWLLFLFLLPAALIFAQDTIVTQYPNTQQRWEKIFLEEQKIAENIYHDNGSPWMTVRYDEDRTENWKWFHTNGNPFFAATIVNEQLQGEYRIWYENGELAERLNFVDRLENGPAVFYHPNGQIAMQGQYTMGVMTGKWAFFSPDGSPATGDWRWQFAALPQFTRLKGSLKEGKPVGTWTYRTTATEKKGPQPVLIWEY